MELLQQYWMVLFLLAAGHGLFLFVLLLRASKKQYYLKYLASLVLLFSISLIYYVGFWTGITPTISPFWGLILTLPTLFGPLIYAYAKALEDKKINWWWHGLPFALHCSFSFLYFLQHQNGWDWTAFNQTGFALATIVQNLSLILYSMLILKTGAKDNRAYLWVRWSFLGFTCSFVLYYVLVSTIDFKPQHDYIISLFMSLFMFTVGYLSLQPPKLTSPKSRLPRLSPQLRSVYRKKLLHHMQYDKPYLKGDLKLKDVADHLEMTVHHLSELINTEMGVNFAEFINKYRVEEAVTLLNSDDGIMQIGYQVGFNNKTSFSQTFKKVTGYTPSQFRSLRSTTLAK